jgi:hypothetical protein
VTVTYRCPRCGGDHHADEHDLAPTARGLTRAQLAALRSSVLEELAHAAVAGAEADYLRKVAGVVATVDRRLDRLADRDGPTLARRLQISAEHGATFSGGG